MDDLEHFEPALRRILFELRSYLGDLVVIGGWVPFLHRQYGGLSDWRSRLSRTVELDLLLMPPLPAGARPPLATLLTNAGLRPVGRSSTAAVWEADARVGEVVEFLVPHKGSAKQVGRVQPVSGQDGIGGISLPDVELLQEHSVQLVIPLAGANAATTALRIRVPSLGAYLTSKAATFFRRQPTPAATGTAPAEQKRAKDLLYIRDLMAAGRAVESRIKSDLAELRKTKRGRSWVNHAAGQLGLLLAGTDDMLPGEVAAMLAERDGLSTGPAKADLKGHLSDALEMLRPATGRGA